jgi:hypothetical protein
MYPKFPLLVHYFTLHFSRLGRKGEIPQAPAFFALELEALADEGPFPWPEHLLHGVTLFPFFGVGHEIEFRPVIRARLRIAGKVVLLNDGFGEWRSQRLAASPE